MQELRELRKQEQMVRNVQAIFEGEDDDEYVQTE
jgi:hypothetical protein